MLKSNTINNVQNIIMRALDKCPYEKNLDRHIFLLERMSFLYYTANLSYYYEFLENKVHNLIQSFSDTISYKPRENVIIFYDGFGLSNRGLAKVYINALVSCFKVIYISYEELKDSASELIDIVQSNNGEVYLVTGKSRKEILFDLIESFEETKAEKIIYYSKPNDILGLVAVGRFKNVEKYMVNLTDHAYWTGYSLFDYVLEFRNYGACISSQFRKIPKEKLILLPYYPSIDSKKEFGGFPLGLKSDSRIIFSGGNLYKTISDDGLYYTIVEHILQRNKDTVFWYAGEGDKTNIEMLIRKYPNRVFHTAERTDLHEVMKRCYFYLSTYPLGGGLMLQHAVLANKVPFTLSLDDSISDILIEQNRLNIVFSNIESLFKEIDKCLDDEEYLKGKQQELKHAVISEKEFIENICKILRSKQSDYEIEYRIIDTTKLKDTYISRLKDYDIYKCLLTKKDIVNALISYPRTTLRVIMLLFLKKLRNLWKKSGQEKPII